MSSIKEKLYSPVFVRIFDREEQDWNDYHEDDPTYPMSQSDAAYYAEEIQAALLRENQSLDRVRGLMEYFYGDVDVDTKVRSLFVDVEVVEGKLWGVATIELTEELDSDELAALKDYLSGQYSDGFGEGFEQREVKVGHQDLYVSLWDSSDEFFIDTERAFKQRLGLEAERPPAKLSLAETLAQNAQKSREQFGAPTPNPSRSKEEHSL